MHTIHHAAVRNVNRHGPDILLWVALLTPFVYIPSDILATRYLKLYLLLALALAAVLMPSTRNAAHTTLRHLSFTARVTLSILGLGVLLSVLLSTFTALSFLGTQPDFVGLGMWISAVVIGLVTAGRLRDTLRSPILATVAACMLAISILMHITELRYGIRLDGLMLQASSMGIVAAILGIIALEQLNTTKDQLERGIAIALFSLSLTALILTQSRMTTIGFSVALILFLIWHQPHSRLSMWAAILGVFFAVGLPYASPNYFSRYGNQDVTEGSSYRLSLYKLTTKEALGKHLVYGGGGGTTPTSINDIYEAPPDIQQSLRQHVTFISSHDMYLDIALSFGVVASLAIFILSIQGLGRVSSAHDWILVAVLLLVLINALLNVPSLEVTPFFFIVLFASLTHPKTKRDRNSAD